MENLEIIVLKLLETWESKCKKSHDFVKIVVEWGLEEHGIPEERQETIQLLNFALRKMQTVIRDVEAEIEVVIRFLELNGQNINLNFLARCVDPLPRIEHLFNLTKALRNIFLEESEFEEIDNSDSCIYRIISGDYMNSMPPGINSKVDYIRTLYAVHIGRSKLMKFLVRYGFCYECIQCGYEEMYRATLHLGMDLFAPSDNMVIECISGYSHSECIARANDAIIAFNNSKKAISPRRTLLILLGIEAIHQAEREISNFVICIKLYFRTITEPYITAKEMKQFLLVVTQEDHDSNGTVKKWCDKLVKLMPECGGAYQPRTLLHLCRCEVRAVLRQSRRILPESLLQLDIPSPLHSFILADYE